MANCASSLEFDDDGVGLKKAALKKAAVGSLLEAIANMIVA